MQNKFVHLHVHTEYSLLDGLSKIDSLIVHAKENEMDTLAITDHGVMYGAIEFYKKCKKEGIKPVIGMEGYTTNINLRERPERDKFQNFHLLLLAKDKEGYQNLMKLTSIAHLEGFYYRPRIDRETLAQYSKGLIVTSACQQGEVAQALVTDNFNKAKEIAEWFLKVFGKDYYLEIQRHEYKKFIETAESTEVKASLLESAENEEKIVKGVVKLSRELGIPLVATNDAHYVKKEDAQAQDALVCVATGKNISDVKRLRFIDTPTFYIKSPAEMGNLFSDLPEAIKNTVKIGEKCDVSLTLDKWFFPKYELTEGKTPEDELTKRAHEGLKERIPSAEKVVQERLEYELKIIKDKGYATYFLIVADMARWVNEHGIITNTRGSAAGSLVSYSLGIININPLTYDLPFERFLTPWRPSPPDIDFDIADDKREEVVNYIGEKYGHDRVAQICTFGRMLARGSVRDIARVLGYPYAIGDRISKLIPLGSQGFPMDIKKALKLSPELNNLYQQDADSKKVLDLALQVEGNARHVSVHAAGIVIAPENIKNFTPLQLDPEGKKIITQYDMDSLDPNISPGEAVGLLKFDLLGLRNLSTLGAAITIVKDQRKIDINLQKIPLNDKETFKMLSKGETMGVFQLSGSGMTRYLKELKPSRVEDLMVMVALYRPGPMSQIPAYIERKNNPEKVRYFDPRMKDYLLKSYGLMVYQDDVFLTAINLAGYTWEEADKFRKAVGKKIPAEMEKQRQKFIEGCIKKGMGEEKAQELFHLIEPFSGYGFNKAHAASYGIVAYQTAYMKANFPVEFMTAFLTAESADSEKISLAISECRRMKIKVLAPDINESEVDFKIVKEKDSLQEQAIRFGFSAIKNVGEAAIQAILEARAEGPFSSFSDFVARIDLRRINKKVLESLIKVGALSLFGKRAVLLSSLDKVREKVAKPRSQTPGQQDLFSSEEKSKKTTSTREIYLDTAVEEFSQEEIQSLERTLLGFSLTAKPVNELIKGLENEATHKIYELSPQATFGDNVKIAAVVTEVRVVVTRNTASEMAFVKVEDETGTIELVVFPKLFKFTRDHWVEYKPLLITGRVDSREDTPTLIVESIDTKESLQQKNKELFIRIPEESTSENLKDLKRLLTINPGVYPVTLVFEGKNQRIKLPLRISWSEALAMEISTALEGKGNIGIQ